MSSSSAGGMLPITYALLAECMPNQHRGWTLVLVGAFGLIGGWFAASGCAALFEPTYGWRIMWFLNAPTGLILILCNNFIPESPRFLLASGRIAEARALIERFAVQLDPRHWADAGRPEAAGAGSAASLVQSRFRAMTATLNLAAAAWGLVNFGLLLWLLPSQEKESTSFPLPLITANIPTPEDVFPVGLSSAKAVPASAKYLPAARSIVLSARSSPKDSETKPRLSLWCFRPILRMIRM